MKLAICSDIHLEFGDFFIKNTENAEVLILSGDIMVADDLSKHPEESLTGIKDLSKLSQRQLAAYVYRNFLRRSSKEFDHVVYVAGNHEFYHGRWTKTLDVLKYECAKFGNIHFLEQDSWIYKDTCFVGGTLWTDLNKMDPLTMMSIKNVMNDYRQITFDVIDFSRLKPSHVIKRHQETLKFFKNTIQDNAQQKYIVVSHHAPTKMSIDERYKDDFILNGAYVSDLSDFILDNPKIKLWTHGHIHTEMDYMVGSTRVVCNPRGYVGYDRDTQDREPYIPYYIEI